ncbi:MAG: hypothetical protein WC449_05340 [Candidatus Paceibacterota bacterium]
MSRIIRPGKFRRDTGQPEPVIPTSGTPPIICPACKTCDTFLPGIQLYPTGIIGQLTIANIFICSNCGVPLKIGGTSGDNNTQTNQETSNQETQEASKEAVSPGTPAVDEPKL